MRKSALDRVRFSAVVGRSAPPPGR